MEKRDLPSPVFGIASSIAAATSSATSGIRTPRLRVKGPRMTCTCIGFSWISFAIVYFPCTSLKLEICLQYSCA